MITMLAQLMDAMKKDDIMKFMNTNTLMLVILSLVIIYMDARLKKLNVMIILNVPLIHVILTVRKQALVNM